MPHTQDNIVPLRLSGPPVLGFAGTDDLLLALLRDGQVLIAATHPNGADGWQTAMLPPAAARHLRVALVAAVLPRELTADGGTLQLHRLPNGWLEIAHTGWLRTLFLTPRQTAALREDLAELLPLIWPPRPLGRPAMLPEIVA